MRREKEGGDLRGDDAILQLKRLLYVVKILGIPQPNIIGSVRIHRFILQGADRFVQVAGCAFVSFHSSL